MFIVLWTKKPSSSDRSDICRPDVAPPGLGKHSAYKTINISPPLGAEEAISTTKSVSIRKFITSQSTRSLPLPVPYHLASKIIHVARPLTVESKLPEAMV